MSTLPELSAAAEASECAGWRDGSRDTFVDNITKQALPGGFTSQFRQDSQLWKHLFAHPLKELAGAYIDVAANHYKRISNTYFYDRCLGWKGICVEPNGIYHDELRWAPTCLRICRVAVWQLCTCCLPFHSPVLLPAASCPCLCRRRRSCHLVPRCASNNSNPVDLVFPPGQWGGGLGGVVGSDSYRGILKRPSAWRADWVKTRMRCVLLRDVLARQGFTRVDLLSLDVEGHEAEVRAVAQRTLTHRL